MDVFTIYRFYDGVKERIDQKETILQAAAVVESKIAEDKAWGFDAGYSIEKECSKDENLD